MPIGDGHGAVRLVDVSGNTIQLDTSGRITLAGGSITASVSGEPVKVSGETVIAKVSGETVISNVSGSTVTAKISGETVISTVSGNVVVTSVSGNAVIFSGQGVWVSGSVSVSGNAVTSSGDTYITKISGETIIAKVSGEGIWISGTVIGKVSGEVVVVQSGGAVRLLNLAGTSGIATPTFGSDVTQGSQNTGLAVYSLTTAMEPIQGVVNRVRTTASGTAASQSGLIFRLLTCVSGDPVKVSGETVNMAAQTITAPDWLAITGNSGGTVLATQACTMVRITNLSGNNIMLVGGTGTAAPVSGSKGIPLASNTTTTQGIDTSMDFPVTNANLLRVVAHTDGQKIAYMTFG